MQTRTRHRFLAIVFAILFPSLVWGQSFLISDFADSILPAYGHGNLYDITSCPIEFRVNIENKHLVVSEFSMNDSCQLSVENGHFVGTNYGEFGGNLSFISLDSAAEPIEVAAGNVLSVFQCQNVIYFTQGLNHMNQHYGYLCRIDTVGGKYVSTTVAQFSYPPTASTVAGDSILISSGDSLFLVQNGKKKYLLKLGLRVNSIAYSGNNILYLGINGAYVELNLYTKERRFFVYKKV